MSIAGNIITYLSTILASVTEENDYTYEVTEVVVPTRHQDPTPQHGQVLIKLISTTENEQLSCPGNPPLVAYDLNIMVTVQLLPDEVDSTKIDEMGTHFGAELKQAITTVEDWERMDGNAVNTKLGPVVLVYPDDDGPAAAGFVVTSTYRTRENTLNEV